MLTSYWPEADTYGIQVKLGPSAGEVPTLTVDTRTACVVPAMLVFASFSVHVPVKLLLDGFGAKQDCPFCLLTADANAPEERSCSMCRPEELPVNCDNLICTPVKFDASFWNRKSW